VAAAHHLVSVEHRRNGTVLRAAALWIVFLGLYLLFAAPVSSSELTAGIPAAAAVTGFALAYRRAEQRRMDLRAPWFRVILRALAAIPGDVVRVGGALAGSLWRVPAAQVGTAAHQPFRQGDNTAADAARRAIVVLGTSLAPNGYVLMMPQGSETMVLHRLVLTAPRAEREWPV
jgi:hypothetical protein